MDVIIREIIDVDRRAKGIEEKAQREIERERAEREKRAEELRQEIISKAKEDAKKLYEEARSEALEKAEKIKNEGKRRCDELERKFESIKYDVERRAFQEIIKGAGEA